MDDGLIQVLVIAVFVILSMMDGAARKRRKQAQSSEHLPESPPQTREEIAAWSAEDDLGEAAESPGVRMELKDVWEEIATLAGGEVPGREADPVRGPATVDADAILHEKHTEVAVPSPPSGHTSLYSIPLNWRPGRRKSFAALRNGGVCSRGSGVVPRTPSGRPSFWPRC